MSESTATADAKANIGCEYSNPIKALGHMFRHLFDFSGRATRKEFLMSLVGLAGLLCALLLCGIFWDLGDLLVLIGTVGVLSLTSLMVRRHHDFGYDGVVVVIAVLVFPLWIFSIPFLVIECMLHASQDGCNKYGMSSGRPSLVADGKSVTMFPVKKSFGCSGWGCLTLLVMAVAMWLLLNLPFLFPHVITHAQYAAEVLPAISDVRAKIGHCLDERKLLPGVSIESESDNGLYTSSVQTFVLNRDASDGKYVPAYCADDYRTVISVGGGNQPQHQMRHFVGDVVLDLSNLHGKKCTPAGYRYWATGVSSNCYAYCVGYFPADDCHLRPGTGYAVLEISATDKSVRRTATWERYKPIDSARIVLRPATNAAETARSVGEGTCWLGHPKLYLSDNLEKVEQGIRELKDAGWSFDDD